MVIIKLNDNHRFILEVPNPLPERQAESIRDEWNKLFPNNPIIIIPSGTFKIIEAS